jgi:hypothetical protein
MKKPMTISEARAKLPELAKKVSGTPGAVEYIQHRDLPDYLVLTTASHISYLEDTIRALRKQLAVPFTLLGSIESDLTEDELELRLAQSRVENAAKEAEKLKEVAE